MVEGTVAPVAPRKPRSDAEAICEAVTRPTMRFVPVKSAARQAALLDHKARDFLVRQRTQTVNAIRAHPLPDRAFRNEMSREGGRVRRRRGEGHS